jgi:hypothetical protein
MQLGPEGLERNHRGNRYKRIVLFGETFIASVQIEEAKLSHANLPRSEYENLESDLRGGGKRLFFEVPLCQIAESSTYYYAEFLDRRWSIQQASVFQEDCTAATPHRSGFDYKKTSDIAATCYCFQVHAK